MELGTIQRCFGQRSQFEELLNAFVTTEYPPQSFWAFDTNGLGNSAQVEDETFAVLKKMINASL